MTVYLIDDDSEEAELFSDAIEQIDGSIKVVWRSNVMEALEELLRSETLPHAVFLDLNIPPMSGKELLRMLRVNEKTQDLPVIIYSTSISKKDMDETVVYNVKSYLKKPEDFKSLCASLKDILL